MDERFWIALLILAGFALYVAAKVIAVMQKGDRQWQQVDKSKLKTWEDEDE